jgi:hypothetical protein
VLEVLDAAAGEPLTRRAIRDACRMRSTSVGEALAESADWSRCRAISQREIPASGTKYTAMSSCSTPLPSPIFSSPPERERELPVAEPRATRTRACGHRSREKHQIHGAVGLLQPQGID